MGLKEILEKIGQIGIGNIGMMVFILLSLIQIAPIKIDPWSRLIKWIGKIINSEVMEEVKEIKEDLQSVHTELDDLKALDEKREADAARNRILRFDDELRRKVDHSEEFFNQILDDVTAYTTYCDNNDKYPNSRADGAIKHIEEVHAYCKENDKFI